jgi:glutamine amidotransferase
MLGYIETGVSNTGSVVNAFHRIGVEPAPVGRPEDVEAASALVLPGVGAFGDGMAALRERGLVEPIQRAVRGGVPIIGICLGMQLLADAGEEYGSHRGLGLVPGTIKPLIADQPDFAVPNIGWSAVSPTRGGVLFDAADTGQFFYFLHSFHLQPANSAVVAATFSFSGRPVVAAIEDRAIFGIQFHPEKSQDAGLNLLSRFVDTIRQSDRL